MNSELKPRPKHHLPLNHGTVFCNIKPMPNKFGEKQFITYIKTVIAKANRFIYCTMLSDVTLA